MKKDDFLKAIEEVTNKVKLQKLVEEEGLDIESSEFEGKNLAECKAMVLEFCSDIDEADWDAEDEDEDAEKAAPESEDEDDDKDEDEEVETSSGRNRKKERSKTASEIAKTVIRDPNRDVDAISRKVKYINNLRDVEGEYGEYQMGTLTIDTPIDGYIAVEDEIGDIEYKIGDQTMVSFVVSSLIATIREHPQLRGLYNKIKDDSKLLYQIMADTTVKMLVEYVPANTEWSNPFSARTNPTVRTYDHDTCIVMIYGIDKLGANAQLWVDMNLIGEMGMSNPAVVLALLDRAKKGMR